MSIREELEDREKETLSPYACLSVDSRGRDRQEEPCDIRPCFQRDRDRIIHSRSFRSLKDKTQVFLAPKGDHYRTRLTHTLEVSQIARTIAKALRLNEDLVEAIALGHDLGHTPFGHAGERGLNRVAPAGFHHSEQSVRVVERLERDLHGLNLTWEVRDGIRNHQMSGEPSTLEGKAVRLSDKIAYIHHDMDDSIRAGLLSEEDVPGDIRDLLGATAGRRLDSLIHDVITTSAELGGSDVRMSKPVFEAMTDLRSFMFDRVYSNTSADSESGKAEQLVSTMYGYYLEHQDAIGEEYAPLLARGDAVEQVICDYISSMSDKSAISEFNRLFVPKAWDR